MNINLPSSNALLNFFALPLATSSFSFPFFQDIFSFFSNPFNNPIDVSHQFSALDSKEICLLPNNALTGLMKDSLNICYSHEYSEIKEIEKLNKLANSGKLDRLEKSGKFRDLIFDKKFKEALKFIKLNYPIQFYLSQDDLAYAQSQASRDGDLSFVREINLLNLMDVNIVNFHTAIENAAENGHLSVLRILVAKIRGLELQKLNHMLRVGLKAAAEYGHLECLRYLCESTKTSLEDKIDLLSQGTASIHFPILEYMITHLEFSRIPSDAIEQALMQTVKHMNKDGVSYLLKVYSFTQNVKDNALLNAVQASLKIKESPGLVTNLIQSGASIYAHQEVINFLVGIGEEPLDGSRLNLLIPEHKKMLFMAHLKHSLLTPEIYQLIVDHIIGLTDAPLYEMLEEMITHHPFNGDMLEPFLDRLEKLPEDHLFRLARLAVIKNDPPELFEKILKKIDKVLSEDLKQNLLKIQARQLFKIGEKALVKQQILQAFNEGVQRKDKVEKEEKFKKIVQDHSKKLIEIYEKRGRYRSGDCDGGVHYYNGGETFIAEMDILPGILFKFSTRGILKKYNNANKSRQAIEKHGLDHIYIPNQVHITELDGLSVDILVEEKLDLLFMDNFYERLQMMNEDPDLLPIANEFVRQLTVFIMETGLADLKMNNMGLLKNGAGFGIIDFDHFGIFDREGYLTPFVYPSNFQTMRETEKLTSEKNVGRENNRRLQCIELAKKKRVWAKHGVIDAGDPIDFDLRLLSELSPEDKLRAVSMIQLLNEKVSKVDKNGGRKIIYEPLNLKKLSGWNNIAEEKYSNRNFRKKHDEITNYLIRKEIIHGPSVDEGGAWYSVYC